MPNENLLNPKEQLKNNDTKIEPNLKSLNLGQYDNEEFSIQTTALVMVLIPVIGASSYFLIRKKRAEHKQTMKNN